MMTRTVEAFAVMFDSAGEKRYQDEVVRLETLSPQEAKREARLIIKRLAYSAYQHHYSTTSMKERFDHLWELAFPNGELTKKGVEG